jgi:putrescine aminotransferase
MFACQHEDVTPDLMCLSKGLSGGLVPAGAVLVSERLTKVMADPRKASHFSTTFAGGRLAAAVAMEVIRLLVEERLPEQAGRLGRQLEDGLERLRGQHPRLLRAVRGRGLIWGIELADPVDIPNKFLPQGVSDFLTSRVGGSVAIAMQRYVLKHHGVLLAPTAADRRVVRMFPPLTSEPDEIAHLLEGLEGALAAGLSAWVRSLS